jgi:signal transduction histidine kinase
VEAPGGRLWAESGDGQGTTYSFTLPRAAAEAWEAGARSASSPA